MKQLFKRWWVKLVRANGRPSLSRKALFVFVSQVFGAMLALLLQVCFARWAGSEEYGVYSYALSWTTLLSLFGTLGFPQAVVRFLPVYQAREEWSRLSGLVKSGEGLMLAVGSVVACLSTFVLFLLEDFSGSMGRAFLIAFWMIPFVTLLKFQSAVCRAAYHVDLAYGLPHLLRPLLMLGGGLLIMASQASLTGPQAVFIAAVSILIVWSWQRWQFRARLPSAVRSADPAYAFRSWLRVSMPLLWTGGMFVVLNNTDLLMIGGLLGPREAGLYKAATRLAAGISFVLVAINAVAAPRFAALHMTGDQEALRRLVQQLAHWIFWPSLLLTIGLCLFSEVLLGLFGPAFPTARWVLIILAGGQLVNAGAGPVAYLLNMTDHQQISARILGWSALLNVAMNALGIYLLGLMGAALATTLCTVVWNVWMHRRVAQELHLRPSILSAVKPLFARHGTHA